MGTAVISTRGSKVLSLAAARSTFAKPSSPRRPHRPREAARAFGGFESFIARKRRQRRFDAKRDRCYTCDEHVPPRSFFPPRLQGKALDTVPACAAHNQDNGPHIEYVRNVLAIQYGTNAVAEEVSDRAKASWDHSPKLLKRTFSDFETAEVVGAATTEEIGVFTIDLPRVKRVVEAIAHGLYCRGKGRYRPGTFEIFCAFHSEQSLPGLPDGSEARGRFLSARPYEPRMTNHPNLWELQVHASEHELIFAMRNRCTYRA